MNNTRTESLTVDFASKNFCLWSHFTSNTEKLFSVNLDIKRLIHALISATTNL